jgi:hypothetical protein
MGYLNQPNLTQMERIIALALIAFGLGALSTQKLSAMQVLVVASNGKWAMEYDPYAKDFGPITAKAIADCIAKGGKNPQVVWSQGVSLWKAHYSIAHGAIAVSDNGAGTIVGWSFNHPYQNWKIAKAECVRKGGQHPKTVAKF